MAAGATYEPIATYTLGSAAKPITFSSIPATYTDLRVVLVALGATGSLRPTIKFNSDSSTNYSATRLYGDGSSAASDRYTSSSDGIYGAANISTSISGLITFDIFSYAGSTYKTVLFTGSTDDNTANGKVDRTVGLWRSTSAITQIDLGNLFSSNYAIGTTATLYGIKSA